MPSIMFVAFVTGLVIAATLLVKFLFDFIRILLIKPIQSKGAIEIDVNEHIYAHPDYVDSLHNAETLDVQTVYEVIKRGVRLASNRPHFSFRQSSDQPFQSYTYTQVYKMIHEIGSGVVRTGLEPSNETFIGIYGSASVNYVLCLFSCWPYSFVPVGIYDSLGKDGVRFIIQHADLQLIFADDLQRVRNLLDWKDETSTLKTIVSITEPTAELIQMAKDKNINLFTLQKIIEMGRNEPAEPLVPKSTDTAMIMYTSGSTGEPKGCIITHENFLTGMFGVGLAINMLEVQREGPMRTLNFMPLAHMFGCGTVLVITYLGGEIGFWQGKVDKLMDDFRDFKPTLLTMVPRLLNKVYDRAMSETRKKGLLARGLMKLAIKAKLALIRRGDFSQKTIWDRLIFNKIRQSFGGKVQRIVSSSAPLSPEVARFSRAAFSCLFIEAYGQTECTIGCWQTLHDMESGETGIPTPLNHVKLIDVPEKEYYARDGVGEICLRSKAVFKGYLKDEEKTRETVDSEGWLHTGDIGRWTPRKTMRIIDRKKNMYKLSQGEYIAPEKIEDVYARSPFVSQIFVYGDSYQNFPVAIVLLNDDFVKKWSAKDDNNVVSLVSPETNAKLRQAIFDDLVRQGKKRGLMSYEQVKAIDFIKEPFTIENGLLTPTFKARRYAVEKKYKSLFLNLYKNMQA